MKRSREPDEHLPLRLPLSPSPSPSAPGTGTGAGTGFATGTSGPATPLGTGSDANDADLPRAKIVDLDPDQRDASESAQPAMICLLHRDRLDFSSYAAYEAHYNKEHLNRCLECRRNFPSLLYLNLHGDEWHDPFVAARRDKGEHTYACFIEGCERKCASADKRRRHLIDKHSFPKNFFFAITQFGIDGRHSLLDDGGRRQHQRRRSSVTIVKKEARRHAASSSLSETPGKAAGDGPGDSPKARERSDSKIEMDDVDSGGKDEGDHDRTQLASSQEREVPDVDMDDLAGAMSAMAFVPRSVKFGRGGKVGFARRS